MIVYKSFDLAQDRPVSKNPGRYITSSQLTYSLVRTLSMMLSRLNLMDTLRTVCR